MKYTVNILTETQGTYNQSGDVLPDMLNGEDCPKSMEDMLSWLSDLGYTPDHEFVGWGEVVRHGETGEVLAITERNP